MDKFSTRLKEEREKLKTQDPKWTQEYVAYKLGVARTTYTAYENGTKQPPLDTVTKIADIFNVSTDYLSGRSDIKNPEKKPEGRFFHDLDHASDEDLDKLEEYFKFLQEQKKKRENRNK
ncbi:helix-turn-helix domain-containing protein [Sporolactobacillus sp. KGMB 08714]|uniref:helix-turn-helix domain-containing protein n=1 Tax=Sporolactobacillus sp. KGMB 08714 TaxID=3064704 RepID=UPI002FBD5BFB